MENKMIRGYLYAYRLPVPIFTRTGPRPDLVLLKPGASRSASARRLYHELQALRDHGRIQLESRMVPRVNDTLEDLVAAAKLHENFLYVDQVNPDLEANYRARLGIQVGRAQTADAWSRFFFESHSFAHGFGELVIAPKIRCEYIRERFLQGSTLVEDLPEYPIPSGDLYLRLGEREVRVTGFSR
jgi:hypothetical protein